MKQSSSATSEIERLRKQVALLNDEAAEMYRQHPILNTDDYYEQGAD